MKGKPALGWSGLNGTNQGGASSSKGGKLSEEGEKKLVPRESCAKGEHSSRGLLFKRKGVAHSAPGRDAPTSIQEQQKGETKEKKKGGEQVTISRR